MSTLPRNTSDACNPLRQILEEWRTPPAPAIYLSLDGPFSFSAVRTWSNWRDYLQSGWPSGMRALGGHDLTVVRPPYWSFDAPTQAAYHAQGLDMLLTDISARHGKKACLILERLGADIPGAQVKYERVGAVMV